MTFADVVGLEQAKEALKEAVILPVKFPQLFQGCIALIFVNRVQSHTRLLIFRKKKTVGRHPFVWCKLITIDRISISKKF